MERISRFLTQLSAEKTWCVEVSEYKPRRTLAQNSLLWALYENILEAGGEVMRGWETKDLHDLFLGEHYGWEKLEGMKRARMKPLRRSSSLNKQDFSDHLDFIVRYMAEQGVVLSLPGEEAA